jgi:hypothetical protein
VAVVLASGAVFGPMVWRVIRSTGGLRRGWEPAPEADGEKILSGPEPAAPGDADVIPLSGACRPVASEPAELAGRGR